MKVCAIVVTYNRKELLRAQLDSMAEQDFKVDDYYIIDNNGNDGTDQMIKEIKERYPLRLHYIKLTKNVGGAGGFSYGLRKAFEDSYDWYILMDDDGRPYDNKCFLNVFEMIKRKEFSPDKQFFLNSLVTYDNKSLSFGLGHIDTVDKCLSNSSDGLFMKVVNPFNGTVLSNGLIKTIGFPNGDFFIKGDEVDYYRRAIASDALIATVVDSRYRHPKPEGITHKIILGKERYIYIETPWKEYYNVRNSVYSLRAMKKKRQAYSFALNRVICCFLCQCEKTSTLKMIFRGYKDGKNRKLGATVKPGEKA